MKGIVERMDVAEEEEEGHDVGGENHEEEGLV